MGTVVRIRVQGLLPDMANDAIDGAFDLIADVHRLMSFHEPGSELSQLNGEASRGAVPISSHTQAVLSRALELSEASEGLFDPTIAPTLVADGLLPPVPGALPVAGASWKEVVMSPDGTVSFARPLWLDLGGIAKGYAVDCAFDHIASCGPTHLCVEAGGDLRLMGPAPELVYLSTPYVGGAIPAVCIENAAVASSGSQMLSDGAGGRRLVSPHIDPRSGRHCKTDRFVTVIAPRCIDADALTKVVMASGSASAPVLKRYQALAFMLDGSTWTSICSNLPMPAPGDP